MMWVAMYYSNKDVRIEEMPVPKIGEGELLVRVEASGICGTDVLEWYRINRVPLVLGHEVAGVVAEIGKGTRGFSKGDRLVVAHHVPCNECHYCLNGHETVCETLRKTNFEPGGFAEYIRVPKINVKRGIFILPKEVSFEEGTFIEPLACVLRGQKLAGMSKGKSVLVLGAGISGILHIQLAKHLDARRIISTDINDYRLKMAKKFGADVVIRADDEIPKVLREVNNGMLADLVIVCTGAKSALVQALKSVERGGTVLFFAATEKDVTIPLSVNDIFWRNEVTLMSSYAGSPADHWEALDLIRSGEIRVAEMITHRLGLNETGLGFQLVAKAEKSLKVIIQPQK
jgi:L-iditol 2-dehydrogenase